MQDLLKHLPAVFYEYAIFPDGRCKFLYLSEAAESILGVSPEEATSDAALLESRIHKEDWGQFNESSKTSHKEGRDWHWQGRMMIKDPAIYYKQ